MTLSLKNIEKEVAKAAKKIGSDLITTFDCGNAYITVKGSNHCITSVIFDDNGEFSIIYTTQYKQEILDDDYDYTGEFEDCEIEQYSGSVLLTALQKLRRYA